MNGRFEATHGHSVGNKRSRTYRSWEGMRSRCNNRNDPFYWLYGGRGIKVCERWDDFQNFLIDMGERPEGLTLERRDRDKNYMPENCCWATAKEQSVNRSTTVWFEVDGRRQHLADWCREYGISGQLVRWRMRHQGCSFEQALRTPKRRQKRNGEESVSQIHQDW
jgi:hypothetical protein